MNFTASLEFTKLKQTLSDMLTATVGGLLWETQSSFRYLGGHRRSRAGAPRERYNA
jgi:hypothetical protein